MIKLTINGKIIQIQNEEKRKMIKITMKKVNIKKRNGKNRNHKNTQSTNKYSKIYIKTKKIQILKKTNTKK